MDRRGDQERDASLAADLTEAAEAKRRKKKPDQEMPPEPEAVGAGSDDAEPAAESAERSEPTEPGPRVDHHREELTEVLAKLPAELRFRFEQAVAAAGGRWSFERGRYLYRRLVREEAVTTAAGPILVRERFTARRDDPPRPLREFERQQLVEQVLADPTDRKGMVAEVRDRLGGLDAVEVVVADMVVLEVTAPRERPRRTAGAADRPPAGDVLTDSYPARNGGPPQKPVLPRREVPPRALPPSEAVPDNPDQPDSTTADQAQSNDTVEPDQAIPDRDPAESTTTAPELPDAELERLVEEIYQEPTPEPPGHRTEQPTSAIPAEAPSPGSGSVPEPTEAAPTEPAEPQPDPETADPAPDLGTVLAEVMEELDSQVTLPPMAGGSPELDRSPRRRRRPDEDGAAAPRRRPPQREPRIRPSRRSETALLEWERRHRTPEDRPDFRMRYKARKLVRVLARRYGIRLTPDTEAKLLEIVLRPRLVGGRKVYGLGLNRETLLATIRELWLHFPAAAPRIDPGIY